MDASAIQAIQDLAVDAAKQRVQTIGDTPVLFLADGTPYNLERYLENRTRFRGKFATQSLDDFVKYVSDHEAEGFISTDQMKARVFINLGNAAIPGHADWYADLELVPTAPYQAALAANGRVFSQTEIVEFIEDWSNVLTAIDQNLDPIDLTKVIAAFRAITISASSTKENVESNFGRVRSALEKVEASARDTLPSFLIVRTEPFVGLPEVDIQLRVSILTTQEKPAVRLRMIKKEALIEEIGQSFAKILRQKIGDHIPMLLGSFTP